MMAQGDAPPPPPQPVARTGRRPWSRKLTPAQIKLIAEKYYGGGDVQTIMREFGIGRSSLYRYLHDYKNDPDVTNDVTHLRIECERFKSLALDLALENKKLRAQLAQEPVV